MVRYVVKHKDNFTSLYNIFVVSCLYSFINYCSVAFANGKQLELTSSNATLSMH
jgi:hypothetical protein